MASESIYAPKNVELVKLEDNTTSSEEDVPPPNPYLTTPLLYMNEIDATVSDRDLANGVFAPFVPVR
jgi:hypothetical protein